LALSDGSAAQPLDFNGGNPEDYQYRLGNTGAWVNMPGNGVIDLPAGGDQLIQVRVNTLTDALDEVQENFSLQADLDSNGTSASDTGTGLINDTTEPTVNVGAATTGLGDITVPEGDDAIFGVLINGAAPGSQLALSLNEGSALSPEDYNSGQPDNYQYRFGSSGAWLAVPANGIINLTSGGDQLIQVRTNTVDDLLDEVDEDFTLAATLTSLGVDYSDTGTATIVDDDERPTNLNADNATVSEEGISPAGLPDTTGTPDDSTDSASATGTISFDDAGDNNPFSISLSGPSGITVDGQAVTWVYDSNTLTLSGSSQDGSNSVAVASVVLSNPVSNGGSHSYDYTVTLQRAIDHAGIDQEDVHDLQFEVSVSDGVHPAVSSNFNVSVEDDSPEVSSIARQIDVPPARTNVSIILDLSGSMNDANRLVLAKQAINKLIDTYEDNGEVRVNIVTFNNTAAQVGSYWQDSGSAKTTINGLSAGSATNYDAALAVAQEAYSAGNNGNMLNGANNVLYFLSDGLPNRSDGNVNALINFNQSGADYDDGIQSGEESIWSNFLIANKITAFSFGMGPGVTLGSLNPIAYDGAFDDGAGTVGQNTDATQVLNLNDLDDALQDTVELPLVEGNLLGNLGGQFGADGGIILEFVDRRDTPNDSSDDVLYRYDRANNEITNTVSNQVIAGQSLSLTTALGAVLTVDMVSGDYAYEASYQVTSSVSEYFSFSLRDRDGDISTNSDEPAQSDATLTFNVSRLGVTVSPLSIARQATVEDEQSPKLTGLLEPDNATLQMPALQSTTSTFKGEAFKLDTEPAVMLGTAALSLGDILDFGEPDSLDQLLQQSTGGSQLSVPASGLQQASNDDVNELLDLQQNPWENTLLFGDNSMII
ncbi:MAG: VWA domain-containing protein, partial [Cellvibrionaceae bacterium]|nr:VWA domain-containing protein [Cellvibrionaceae bacterium]